MKLRSFLFGLILLSSTTALHAGNTQIIAHRGHWTAPGATQNSIAALLKADSIHCYASEFDVWMTADSVLVVNHDPHTPAGVHIETSPSSQVLATALNNGEMLPTLQQYLTVAQQLPNLRLVLELKEHANRRHEHQAVKQVLQMARDMHLEDRMEYITFSRDAFADFVELSPKGTPVYYLTGDYIPEQTASVGAAGIDYNLSILKKHPEWIARAHAAGQKVNVWTVNKTDDLQWCIDQGVDFITTNDPEQALRMVNE